MPKRTNKSKLKTKATKKVAKKSPPKKKVRTRKKAAPKAPMLKLTENAGDPQVHSLETQNDVWATYERVRSIRAVAKELGLGRWIVAHVVGSDLDRKLNVIADHMEHMVASWEEKYAKSLAIIDELLKVVEYYVKEIAEAITENKPVTAITDQNGVPMTPLAAVAFLTTSRLLDQVLKVASQAHVISSAFRVNEAAASRSSGGQRGAGGSFSFEHLGDMEIVQILRNAGLELPPLIEAKAQQVEGA